MTDLKYSWNVIPTSNADYPFMAQVISERVDGSGYVEWEKLCATEIEANERGAQAFVAYRIGGEVDLHHREIGDDATWAIRCAIGEFT